ncbi:MAG: hypothetical protein K2X34_07440 [Hyphomonadaceae bacterium]|nr:hypothetical protein [Hyphomonadaceae bacterium]
MRTLLIAAAAALLAGCASSVDTADAPSFGDSVAAMRAAQTEETGAQPGAPEGSAAVGTLAQQRYRAGATRTLRPSSTSQQ